MESLCTNGPGGSSSTIWDVTKAGQYINIQDSWVSYRLQLVCLGSPLLPHGIPSCLISPESYYRGESSAIEISWYEDKFSWRTLANTRMVPHRSICGYWCLP